MSATIRVGRQLLQFAALSRPPANEQTVKQVGSPNPGYWGRLTVMLDPDTSAAAIALREPTATVGRDPAQNALAIAEDDRLGAQHCTIGTGPHGPCLDDAGTDGGT